MTIYLAKVDDASILYKVMMAAFEEYRTVYPPSSALDETVDGIKQSLLNNGSAIIYEEDGIAHGTVMFRYIDDELYFSRVSVIPESRGRGIAKAMLSWLENHAVERGINKVKCKVRVSVPRNIQLYKSMGYAVVEEGVVIKPDGHRLKVVTMEKRMGTF